MTDDYCIADERIATQGTMPWINIAGIITQLMQNNSEVIIQAAAELLKELNIKYGKRCYEDKRKYPCCRVGNDIEGPGFSQFL